MTTRRHCERSKAIHPFTYVLGLLTMLVLFLPAQALDLDDYTAKLYPTLKPGLLAFEDFDYSSKQELVGQWLAKTEHKMSGLPNLAATFVFSLNTRGNISALELDQVACTGDCIDPNLYRDFISKLSTLKLEPAPINGLRFILDAQYLVIQRNEAIDLHRDSIATSLSTQGTDTSLEQVLKSIESCKASTGCNATLASTQALINPIVGEEINFRLGGVPLNQYLVGRIITIDDGLLIATDAAHINQEVYSLPIQYWQIDLKPRITPYYDAFISGATSGGLGLALLSHGLGPALLGGLSSVGANLEHYPDITINPGDQFLIKFRKNGGKEICKV